MEESLKARLIGAVVLVALAVLLIPELLSGRKAAEPVAEEGAGPRGTRTFTIELGQAPGQATRSPTTTSAPLPNATPANPLPAPPVTDPGAEPPAGQPAVTVAEAAQTPEPEPTAAPAAATAAKPVQSAPPSVETAPDAAARSEPKPPPAQSAPSGGWAVQVGAFGSADTARKLVQDLSGAGYRAFVSPVNRGGKTLYRVRVGPAGDRAGAEQLVPRLKSRGLPTTVVQND
jgi:cell division septation protein DedD